MKIIFPRVKMLIVKCFFHWSSVNYTQNVTTNVKYSGISLTVYNFSQGSCLELTQLDGMAKWNFNLNIKHIVE